MLVRDDFSNFSIHFLQLKRDIALLPVITHEQQESKARGTVTFAENTVECFVPLLYFTASMLSMRGNVDSQWIMTGRNMRVLLPAWMLLARHRKRNVVHANKPT